jgi:prevent-host-death family protein
MLLLEVLVMTKIPSIIPITDLRQDATGVVKRVTASREPLVITQRGRAAVVMVSMEAYEHSQRELELLRLLARGEKEIEAGKGYDLDAVLAEADTLLKEIPR